MTTAILKGLVNKTFTVLPYKKQRTSTIDPVEMNLDSSVPARQNSMTTTPESYCLLTPALSDCFQPESKDWDIAMPLLDLPGVWSCWWLVLCLRCYRGLCTNCLNTIGVPDVPETPQVAFCQCQGPKVWTRATCAHQRLCRSRGILSSHLGFIMVPIMCFHSVSQDFPSS